jgi:8-oxo-dGTP pyrophosphatase MutT (NUDIX family)
VGYAGRMEPPLRFDRALRERIRRHLEAHDRMCVDLGDRGHAAVALALLADDRDRPCFVLTRRARELRRHAGQWALPGGRIESGESAEEAALRELEEEVGLTLPPSSVLGCLDDYPTRSGFVITPVVTWAASGADLRPSPEEVAEAFRVPIAELERPGVPRLRSIPESERPVISIRLLDANIHAPTAAILYQLREVAIWGRGTRVAHFEQPVFAWR